MTGDVDLPPVREADKAATKVLPPRSSAEPGPKSALATSPLPLPTNVSKKLQQPKNPDSSSSIDLSQTLENFSPTTDSSNTESSGLPSGLSTPATRASKHKTISSVELVSLNKGVPSVIVECSVSLHSELSSQQPQVALKESEEKLTHSSTLLSPKPGLKVRSSHGSRQSVTSRRSLTKNHCRNSRRKFLKVVKRRWYVLAVYCVFTMTQACVWNTFTPIAPQARLVFMWDPHTIHLVRTIGSIAYVVSGVFFAWLMSVKGIRIACILSALLVLLGTALRCFTILNPEATRLILAGQFFNGLAGPMASTGAPKLSACWFPMTERVLATSIGVMAYNMGHAFSYLIGPVIVSEAKLQTMPMNYSGPMVIIDEGNGRFYVPNRMDNRSIGIEPAELQRVKHKISTLMYSEAVWAALVCIGMLVYFPSRPPDPGCLSAQVPREDFVPGIKSIWESRREVLRLAGICALSVGLTNCWFSLLVYNLESHTSWEYSEFNEKYAGYIAFFALSTAIIFCLSMARLVEKYFRYMRQAEMGLLTAAALCFFMFNLVYFGVVNKATEVQVIVMILGKTCVDTCYPAMLELACETTYPVGEDLTVSLLVFVNNVLGLLITGIVYLPGSGVAWLNWILVLSLAACPIILSRHRQKYKRRDIDMNRHRC